MSTLLDVSIINYFEKTLSWDLFVQGFFMLNIFLIVFLLLMYMMPEYHIKNESFLDFLIQSVQNKLLKFFSTSVPKDNEDSQKDDLIGKLTKITQFISLGTLVIILSFIIGVISSEVSDSFMDQSNSIHFGLKKNWTEGNSDLTKTDSYYKEQLFYKVFGKDALNDSVIKSELPNHYINYVKTVSDFNELKYGIISQIYYEGKHQILESDKWREYLSNTQTLINLNQTFCLSSWVLLISSIISLITCFFRKERFDRYKQTNFINYEFFVTTLFLSFFIINIFIPTQYSTFTGITICAILAGFLFGILFQKIKGFRMTTAICFVFLSFILYFLTAIAWRNCEQECDSKTFGLTRHMNKELNGKYFDILLKSKKVSE